MKEFIKEFRERFKAETPNFLRKVRNWALTIGGSCIAALAASVSPGAAPHPVLVSGLTHTLIACAFIAGTAQMAKQDPEEAAREAAEKLAKLNKEDGYNVAAH